MVSRKFARQLMPAISGDPQKDEADNHLVELAIAAGVTYIITNTADFAQAELKHLGYQVITPENLLRLLKS